MKGREGAAKQHDILDPSAGIFAADRSCALAVVAKAPAPGLVKTRLCPPLTGEQAALLSTAFLCDTAANISSVPSRKNCQSVAVYTPVSSSGVFEALLPAGFYLLPQRGDGFGERLHNAVLDLFKLGYESVCLIDSDSPTLPTFSLEAAADALAARGDRVVLGGTEDGGYYLIGLKANHPELFENIAWSTERVLQQTIEQARSIRLPIELLTVWHDVDDAASLRKLHRELFSYKARDHSPPELKPFLAPATRACLARLAGSESFRFAANG